MWSGLEEDAFKIMQVCYVNPDDPVIYLGDRRKARNNLWYIHVIAPGGRGWITEASVIPLRD
jgi:hypothetical protein